MTGTKRCEPPEHLRGTDGWHKVAVPDHAGNPKEQMAWFEAPTAGRHWGFWFIDRRRPGISPYEAMACGWRYVSSIAALVEAMENMVGQWGQEACPVCGGDCGAANPPISMCPVIAIQRAQQELARHRGGAG